MASIILRMVLTLPFLGVAQFAELRAADVQDLASPVHLSAAEALGPDDLITVHALYSDEISDKPIQVDSEGYITLPLAGRVKAEGRTVHQLEMAVADALRVYIREPAVAITVSEYHSQPVAVVGAVKTPGIYQIHGHKTIVDVLAAAGGLDGNAGYSLRITRAKRVGPLPLPSVHPDETSTYNIADIDVQKLLNASDTADNIELKANDRITVPAARLFYVYGEVQKAGGFPLREHENMTVLQALSLSEGLKPTASPKKARVLRVVAGSDKRQEIPVNVSKILKGEAPDVSLHPEDIVFVPNNLPKSASVRALEAAIQTGTGVVIWRHP